MMLEAWLFTREVRGLDSRSGHHGVPADPL
jgi:hypothetical protein